ncbi:4a-hydroxytetrahydrobiopterin dehydratase [Chitinophagales bacterium]|nr:4a-hydroxytetrahydrobiopterin dehydratase [Chitinophagales bacterium]
MPTKPITSKWRTENDELVKEIEFADFDAAFEFMKCAAIVIADHNHHPSWTNSYNKVVIRLCTHDASNTITQKDWSLANALDELI